MAAVKQYRFGAQITFGPAAGHPGGPHACCLVQPRMARYFPAAISGTELPVGPGVRAVVSVALADGEAEAFFPTGQHFTIWADAVIDHAIRAGGMAGHGVVCSPVSAPLPRAHDAPAARAARGRRLAALGAAADHDRGQPVAV
jgi:hypothetical protein